VDTALLVNAWFGGIVAGCGLTLGLMELVSGRFAINLGRGEWSVSEVRIGGLVLCIWALYLAIYVLAMALKPACWDGFQPTILVMMVPLGISTVLLNLHHNRRWPFIRRGVEENR
jgi:hypothetical protein